MTFNELANLVAGDFRETMKTEGFETFTEMAQCYWWDTNDVKDEVDYILRDATNGEAYLDECDRTEVIIGQGASLPYREFSRMWHSALKGEFANA